MKRAWHILLVLALVAQATHAAAPSLAKPVLKILPITPVGPSPITPDCRYLFVVDTSSAMQRSADGLYRTTHRLVANGLGGRMQEGDVFTIWTYADTVLTREFPLNAWTPDLNVALANRAYEFLSQQKFRGKSNLRPVFAELGQALAIATNLTVIFISDGTDVIVGTPFDRPINVTYGKRASEMRSARMPFITALVTQRGEFTHWSVRGGLEDIGLPFPEKPVVPVPLIAQAPAPVTPAPTPIQIPVVTNLPPPPPVVVVPKPPPVAAAAIVPTTKPPVPTPLPPAKPVETAKAAPPATISTNTVPAKPPEPAPVVVTKKVELVPSSPKPVIETPKPSVPAPKSVVAVVPPSPPPPATKAKETLVTPTIPPAVPPVIPPALRQPKSVLDASNALAKVELLRPPATTSTSPAKPLEARAVEPKPAPPKLTNAPVVATKTAPPVRHNATNPPAAKPAPNSVAVTSSPPKTIPIVVPPTTPQKLPAPRAFVPSTNTQTRLVSPAQTAVATAPASPAPKPITSDGKKFSPASEAKPSATTEKAAKPAGQLAIAAPTAHKGGWVYLAAAVALLVIAGSIIAHLLRPRPTPSAISQSLDDKRV